MGGGLASVSSVLLVLVGSPYVVTSYLGVTVFALVDAVV